MSGNPGLPRRGLLGVAAALGAALVPATLTTAAGDDGELLELYRAFLCARDAVIAVTQEPLSPVPGITPASEEHEARLGAAAGRERDLVWMIVDARARSTAGLRAKADVLRHEIESRAIKVDGQIVTDIEDDSLWESERHEVLAWSLASDLLRKDA